MPLFQTKVLKDYLDKQDTKAVEKAYKIYTSYFHNAEVQRNIRSSKEEQFQATFLSKLFVDALSYTLFPDPKYNLTTEYKNETGAQKADGAILSGVNGKAGQKAVAVIELKSTKTKDLESIRKQAFDYKANHTDCRYVITSNFEKLRFYINDAVEWLEFDLFHLSPGDFATLYLCLHKSNLLSDIPQKVKDDSLVQEEKITKQLYKDYSLFRMELYRDLVKRNRRNPQLKELSEKSIKFTLFKKAQKLLDRFLFIFFAEDRGLIPRNMVVKINEEWKQLQDMQVDQSLYERYKIYFNNLDKGNPKHDIFAYNGGLFLPDPVLDTIEIDDDLLFTHTSALTAYDFESEVDVNILGHIFENSLNEIESVNAEIEGVDFDKQKARRKKDGVFYTPKYITKYIVDNTLGKLCDEKKKELEITAEVYENAKQRSKKRLDNLQQYRDWLLQLTICDPACGSGAFLNQALEFLIAEHRYLDELSATYNKDALVLSDIENSILENNLYGVDINQESVEIAKLSLWLRTAQRGRKLTSLSSNIKCGNSLIDAVKVAGDKAFKWEKEFPQVFTKGGFDVVIGNPPYGARLTGIEDGFLRKRFKGGSYQIDTYSLFAELANEIIRERGSVGLIIPSAWVSSVYGKPFRQYLAEETQLQEIVIAGKKTFQDATVETLILIFLNDTPKTQFVVKRWDTNIHEEYNVQLKSILTHSDHNFPVYSNPVALAIIDKIRSQPITIDHYLEVVWGVKVYEKGKGSPPQESSFSKEKVFHSAEKKTENHLPLLGGKEISRYLIKWDGTFLNYGPWLAAPRNPSWFKTNQKRILVREVTSQGQIQAGLLQKESVFSNSIDGLRLRPEQEYDIELFLALLNSKVISFYHANSSPNSFKEAFPKILIKDLRDLPLPNFQRNPKKIKAISAIVKLILNESTKIDQNQNELITLLSAKYDIKDTGKSLKNWPSLDFKGFLKELQKAKVKLSLAEEAEWMTYFNQQKQQVQALQAQIDTLDREIDQLVYDLYGLTEEEIAVVENS